LGQELRLLEAELAKAAYASPQVKLLVTLPGVDVLVAIGLQAALGDIGRFRDGAHAAAYLGLVPRTKQSASHTYHGPITKAGNRQARALLVQAAQQVGRHPGPLGHFFRKLAKRKNRNVAVVATARKLVVIAWQLLTKNEPYRYAQPAVTERKLQKLRVKATGQKRKTGPAKKTPAGPKLRAGVKTKTIKPLGQVYVEEGLPALAAAPAGESRTLAEAECSDYVVSLSQAHVQPKNQGRRQKAALPADCGAAATLTAGTASVP
jgi:transposase